MKTEKPLIHSINILLIAVVAVFSLIFGAVIVRVTSSSMIKQRNDSLLYISDTVALRMRELDRGANQMRSMLVSSPYIRRFLVWQGARDNPSFGQVARQADMFLNNVYEAYRLSSHMCCGVGFYQNREMVLARTDHETYFAKSLKLPPEVEEQLEIGGGSATVFRRMGEGARDIYSMFRMIHDPRTLRRIGIIEIAFDIETAPRLLADANMGDTELYIITPGVGLLSGEPIDEEYRSLLYGGYLAGESDFTYKNRKNRIFRHRTDTVFGDILLVYSSGYVFTETIMLLGYAILFLLFSAVIVAIVSTSLAKRVMRPIQRLTQVVDISGDELSETNLLALRDLQSLSNEIGLLSHSFERYIQKTSEHVQSLKILYNNQRRLELELLFSQIKPHFLYNTMESICGMAKLGYNEELYTIAKEVGVFYRISLSRGEPMISVRNELRHIESYLFIEQIRKRNTLHFSISMDESVADNKVLKLILQPVVENCVQHGLRDMRSGGHISISAEPTFEETTGRSLLLFRIADNGKGMDAETLNRLNSGVRTPGNESGHGFGVFNISERIKLCYGQEYGIAYESEPGGGCTAVITVPQQPPATIPGLDSAI